MVLDRHLLNTECPFRIPLVIALLIKEKGIACVLKVIGISNRLEATNRCMRRQHTMGSV